MNASNGHTDDRPVDIIRMGNETCNGHAINLTLPYAKKLPPYIDTLFCMAREGKGVEI